MYNYGARLYDPVIGRFISADNVIPDWYDPQSLNRYAYCRNNPLVYVDPDGHQIEEAFFYSQFGPLANTPQGKQTQEANKKLGNQIGAAYKNYVLYSDIARHFLFGMVTHPYGTYLNENAGNEEGDTSTPDGAEDQSKSKTPGEMAGELADQIEGNRVSAQTAGGVQVDIDLEGRGHFDKATGEKIETPHVHEGELSRGPNGKVSVDKKTKTTRPATKQDVRTAKEILKRRK